MAHKNIVILGSTGSIGVNTLKVIERFSDKFKVVGITANNNVRLLEKQIRDFSPQYAAVGTKNISVLKRNINTKKIKILDAASDLEWLVGLKSVDIVVIGMSGSAALCPFLSALRAGKRVATANKEALVIAGHLIRHTAKKHKAEIIPVDSEQSAIFQCLEGQCRQDLKKVYLTASGGALLNVPKSRFNQLSVQQILKHPRWKMGKKITVDSATLMNKGFEVIEAKWLFDLEMKDIQVLVHPEAIIHSMVEFRDGSIIAQLGMTDMRLPIQYAMTYPERWKAPLKSLNFAKLKQLNFANPDFKKFPALALAIHVGQKGGTLPSVLNAANEEVVESFINGKVSFSKIYTLVERIVLRHKIIDKPNLKDILAADQWAREEVQPYL